jgi:hypothetical protein
MSKPTISALVLRHVANCLDLAGCNPAPLLVPFGLRTSDLDDPKAVMPLEDYLAFFETAALRAGNPAFGLQAGRLAASDSLGALGFLFLSAPTFRAALQGFSAYLATMQQATANRFTVHEGIATPVKMPLALDSSTWGASSTTPPQRVWGSGLSLALS